MSAYLKYFELEQSPFEGKAQSQVVLGTKALRDALATIQSGLDEGAARICVSGGPGLGKTSLARALPKLLGDSARVAVVLDPSVPWESLRTSIARQWALSSGGLPRSGLIEAAEEGRLVLVIDNAETAAEEFLDHLDVVLSYRSEDDEPVVQSVLLAQLSGGDSTEPPPLIWWLDRIQTLQLEFAPLPRDGVESYIQKHLKRAGWRGPRLFSSDAALAIHGYTGGIPGEVSGLCEQLLAEAAAHGLREIDAAFVHAHGDEAGGDAGLELDADVEREAEAGGLGSIPATDEDAGEDGGGASTEAPTIDLVDAVPSPPARPSLGETLEHFQTDAPGGVADASSDDAMHSVPAKARSVGPTAASSNSTADAFDETSSEPFDDPLSAPPSREELRRIRGTDLARHGRALAAAAAAALIGGLLLAWLTGGDAPPPPSESSGASEQGRDAEALAESGATGGSGPTLARLRGPVLASGQKTREAQSAPPRARSTRPVIREATRTERSALERASAGTSPGLDPVDDPDEDLDEGGSEEDFEDLRPAAMRPGAGR